MNVALSITFISDCCEVALSVCVNQLMPEYIHVKVCQPEPDMNCR